MPTIWDALLGRIPRDPSAPGYAYPPGQVPDVFELMRNATPMTMPPVNTPAMGAPGWMANPGTPSPLGQGVDILGLLARGAGMLPAAPGVESAAGGMVPPQEPGKITLPSRAEYEGNIKVSPGPDGIGNPFPENSPIAALFGSVFGAKPTVPPAAQDVSKQFAWPSAGASPATQTISIPGTGGTQTAGDPVASYLPKMYGAESGGKMVPNAAGASSAFGPAQFTKGTWLDTVKTADPETWRALGGDSDKVLALRADPQYHKTMAEAFTRQNAEILTQKGLPVNDGTLYAMHFFGKAGGPKVLTASPETPIASLIDSDAIAANPHLKGMNAGQAKAWAESTIGAARGSTGSGNAFGLPGAPQTTSPQLPIPPQLAAMQGINPAVFDAFLKARAMMAPPMNTSDRITNVLGQGAGATVGARNVGDLLARFGGGVGKAASENINRDRGELQQGANLSQDLLRQFAETGVKKEEARVQGSNLQTQTANQNAMLLNQVKTEQAKLNTANQNRIKEVESQIDWKKWELGQPQVTVSKDGDSIHTIAKKPDGGIDITTMKLGDGLKKIDEQIKTIRDVTGDKRSPMTDALEIQAINAQAKGNSEVAKALAVTKIARDSIREGTLASILPEDTYKALVKEVEKGLDVKLLGSDAKGYNQQKEDRMFALLEKQRLANPTAFEQLFIPKAASLGNAVALHLMQGGKR